MNQQQMAARYYELCDVRDAKNASVAELQAKLADANARAAKAQDEAREIAAAIQEGRGGGEFWLDLKKEIATLARAMGRIPPRSTPAA